MVHDIMRLARRSHQQQTPAHLSLGSWASAWPYPLSSTFGH